MVLSEIADRVWVTTADASAAGGAAGVVAGVEGLLVVGSSQSTSLEADGLAAAVAALDRGPVLTVALTHVEGASGLRGPAREQLRAVANAWPGAELLAHEGAAPSEDGGSGGGSALACRTFSAAAVVDLGARVVEVIHPGAGHGAGAGVVRVPDADVVWVGELVTGPGREDGRGVPEFGPACYPLAWPSTLDVVLDLLTSASVVVPSRGRLVGRGYVEEQRNDIGLVSQTVRDLAAAGVPATEALERGDWPYPRERLVEAVRRGYAALPPGARQLPRA